MSVRQDLTIDWMLSPRIIEVSGSSVALTIQDLYDTLRDKASLSLAMDDDEIIDGSGKDDLGGGTLVGLTIKLLNAKVKFSNKSSPTVCTISGGNLIAVDADGNSMTPIEPSANVSVVIAQSSSATMIETGVTGLTEAESTLLAVIADVQNDVEFLKKVEGGKWEISGNQMIFYDENNATEVMRFNITKDAAGNPIMRTRV